MVESKKYNLTEMTKIIDNLQKRVRDLELKNEKKWAAKAAKNARKWY